jgi:O-Antigen ligase.
LKISRKISFETAFLVIFVSVLLLTGDIFSAGFGTITASVLLLLMIFKFPKINQKELIIVLPLFLILLSGSVISVFHGTLMSGDKFYLLGKDIWYYLKPIIYILTGFYIFRMKFKEEIFMSLLIYLALFISVHHIIRVIVYVASAGPEPLVLDTLRFQTGPGNLLEVFSLAYVLFIFRNSAIGKSVIFPRWLIILVISVSIILSFSRTLMLAFIISLVAMQDFFSFRAKTFIKTLLVISVIVVVSVLTLLFLHRVSNRNTVIYALSEKYLNSFKEMTYKNKTPTFKEINNNWRGLETNITKEVIRNGNLPEKILGFGFGKTVNIGYTGMPGIEDVNIPKFHNGFIEILLKTGYIGIFFYILYFYFAFRLADRNYPARRTDKLLKAVLATSFATTLVITGLYNKTALDPSCLISGYLMGFCFNTESGARVKDTDN